ncbi:NACHT domain-containing protein [Altererythrobacter sp. Root672]|uniref:NACHT domain-containing protein n=1 Tax=Altererythrobacter sp. Root672 TaxID=1736584 RepID=UPI0007005D96|nr:hypothetical protein [Altererythrobacter sp. Root672]KRA84197.1 hypothetical protein ASD76_09465 [Altererythrobacter sp. Root672]
MTVPAFIPRNLVYSVDGAIAVIAHTELLQRPENLVVLGEAGMGKSRLLEELGKANGKWVTARRLIGASDPRELLAGNSLVLIDALDEAPAFAEGGVVDQILGRLEQATVDRFVLACRSEDWQAATAKSIITETYGDPPLELRLKPFDEAQIADFLTEQLGRERAVEVIAIYHSRGFREWLGNPQTLIMLADVAKSGDLPKTTSELFEAYVELSLRDMNPVRRQRNREISREAALDTLGAAFAALILSGKSALAKPGAEFSADDLRIAELGTLPGFADWTTLSGNRLTVTYRGDSERLTYSHRRIGEWLGARWLAKHAGSVSVSERLFASLTVEGIVPASLRGLFAWLASNSTLALRAIATDPMAIIEYGDADILNEIEARALLTALERLSQDDPWFASWGDFRAKSLIRDSLESETLSVVLDPSRSGRLRILLARQFKGKKLDPAVSAKLQQLAFDRKEFYAIRDQVAEALVGNLATDQLRSFVDGLRYQGTHDATRLAAGMILDAGIEHFDDEQVVQTIFATCGHSVCAVPQEGDDNMAARVWRYRYDIPDERIANILDVLADYATALLPEHRSIESFDIVNLGDALISRQLGLGQVKPKRLLHWLDAFARRGSESDDDKKISAYFAANDDVRRQIQQLWLLRATDATLFLLNYRLAQLNPALQPDDADVAALLEAVPTNHELRFEFMRLTRHTETEGQATRRAALRFFPSRDEHEQYFDKLINPEKPGWQLEDEARHARWLVEQEKRWTAYREGLAQDVPALEQGRFGILSQVANAYLGRYSDLRDLKTAQDRLDALCGPELVPTVFRGFESYLNTLPPYPNAALVAKDYGRSRVWNSSYVLIAALAERVRQTGSVGSLTTDQLISAQLHISNHVASGDEWKPMEAAVWAALIANPSAFEEYAKLLVEPSLARKSEHVSGLYELLHNGRQAFPKLVEELADEWLQRFPYMHERPEAELIDVLLPDNPAKIAPLVKRRLRMKSLNDERRRNWQAVGLISDFNAYASQVAELAKLDAGLFWAIRSRLGGRRQYQDGADHVAIRLAAWLVQHFRETFPVRERPDRVTMGETNAWDATEAIRRLIDRIGSDTTDEPAELLASLAQVEDGYRERILAVLAEYRRTRAEQSRAIVTVDNLQAILSDGPPQNLPDLQAKVLDLLAQVQARIMSSDTDIWAVFYRDDRKMPQDEEFCRDRLIDALRIHEQSIQFNPEKHLGSDREGDIACEYGQLHLPIEVKGQWHDDLWRAADDQLAAQQAIDHRAEGYGVLLVLWFGEAGKRLKGPPRQLRIPTPGSPAELEAALAQASRAAGDGRLKVKVLDLSRG